MCMYIYIYINNYILYILGARGFGKRDIAEGQRAPLIMLL